MFKRMFRTVIPTIISTIIIIDKTPINHFLFFRFGSVRFGSAMLCSVVLFFSVMLKYFFEQLSVPNNTYYIKQFYYSVC